MLLDVLSLVLPTFNEAQNLPGLIDLIDGELKDHPHEIIVVDDNSPDGTWKVAGMLAEQHTSVRVIRRIGKKGLSSAVVEGFDAARGTIFAAMDADGQHDVSLLIKMLGDIKKGADLVVGSRYMPGGSVGEWVTDRRIVSGIGTFLCAQLSCTKISDPLSGFFMLRSDLYKEIRKSLRPSGFKILLEILANAPKKTNVTEVPLIFRMRLHGESKLSLQVQMEFLAQVLRLSVVKLAKASPKFSAPIFWLISAILVAFMLPHAAAIFPLFSDATQRAAFQKALEQASAREGWTLSDVTVESISGSSATITHRDHGRSNNQPRHCLLTLGTAELTCDND